MSLADARQAGGPPGGRADPRDRAAASPYALYNQTKRSNLNESPPFSVAGKIVGLPIWPMGGDFPQSPAQILVSALLLLLWHLPLVLLKGLRQRTFLLECLHEGGRKGWALRIPILEMRMSKHSRSGEMAKPPDEFLLDLETEPQLPGSAS